MSNLYSGDIMNDIKSGSVSGDTSPSPKDIADRVKKIVSDQLGKSSDEIQSDSSFVDDLGADSLDTVELVMALEEEFDLEIADEDAEKISTVQEAVDYIVENS